MYDRRNDSDREYDLVTPWPSKIAMAVASLAIVLLTLLASVSIQADPSDAAPGSGAPEVAAASAQAESTEISPNGSRRSVMGAAEYFTGSVIVDPLFGAKATMPSTGGLVTFAPGARSAWHTHPGGQILIVTSGTGWIQEEGGKKREIKPGDVIWTLPGVKHWHGATATTSMSHIAITNVVGGKNVEWMEKVSDEQYVK